MARCGTANKNTVIQYVNGDKKLLNAIAKFFFIGIFMEIYMDL